MTQIKELCEKTIVSIIMDRNLVGLLDAGDNVVMTFQMDRVFDGNGNLFDYNGLDTGSLRVRSAMWVEGVVHVLGQFDLHMYILEKWLDESGTSEDDADQMIDDGRIKFGYARQIKDKWLFNDSSRHDRDYRKVSDVKI